MASSTTIYFIFTYYLFLTLCQAVTIDIVNQCSYTVWAAAFPGGGTELNPGQFWTINVPSVITGGRIWARTGCVFDNNGKGNCITGDCDGVLVCTGKGSPPNTLAEFALGQFDNQYVIKITLVEGFNVPMDLSPSTDCRGFRCDADIIGQCPSVLRTPGGCNNPCTVFKTNEYCCNSGSCAATNYSKFFKDNCPDAYSYSQDLVRTSTCPGDRGINYRVIFCPPAMKLEVTVKLIAVRS